MNAKTYVNVCALLLATQMGCATIVHGTTQTVKFKNDTKATLLIDGNVVENDEIVLRRDMMHHVEIKSTDCNDSFYIKSSTSGWFAANLLMIIPVFWGVGMLVDAISGAMSELVVPEGGYTLRCIK